MISPRPRLAAMAIAAPKPAVFLAPLRVAAICLAAACLTIVGAITVQNPGLVRPMAACLVVGFLVLISIRWPAAAILLTFGFLVVLALSRRLLISVAGWSSYDPLLLVAPVVALAFVQRIFLHKDRHIAPDLLSKLVLGLIMIALIQTANPLGGGFAVGVTGLLFLAAPLLWFFVGSEFANRRTVWQLIVGLILLAAAESAYGLRQTLAGLPPWDTQWMQVSGYSALIVYSPVHSGGMLRAFGTFTSSSEYATFLGIALVLALSLALHRRILALLAVPLIAWAMFLDSSRGIIVLVLFTAMALLGLRPHRPALGIAIVGAVMATCILTLQLVGGSVQTSALSTGNSLIAHQVTGLLNPFDATQSTLLQHVDRGVSGIAYALQNPLGSGTAATNLAGDKLVGTNLGTEIDISNVFVSLGLLGGVVFLAIVAIALIRVTLAYRRTRELTAFAVAGVLVVTLGQWLNGGQYAVAPLVWFFIGWSSRLRST